MYLSKTITSLAFSMKDSAKKEPAKTNNEKAMTHNQTATTGRLTKPPTAITTELPPSFSIYQNSHRASLER
jgi:hypothetical protein